MELIKKTILSVSVLSDDELFDHLTIEIHCNQHEIVNHEVRLVTHYYCWTTPHPDIVHIQLLLTLHCHGISGEFV